ncbi:hypothetical protein [Staphylococcus capitis]|nr:hypothetical protein [Staphylococcus capitis]
MEIKEVNKGIKFICHDEIEKEVITENWEKLKDVFNQLVKDANK